jgi:hypothetical protein
VPAEHVKQVESQELQILVEELANVPEEQESPQRLFWRYFPVLQELHFVLLSIQVLHVKSQLKH